MDTDLGMLIIRLAVGPMLIIHGYNKMYGAGGIDGTAGWFESLGMRPGRMHATTASLTEMGAGLLLTIGLFTPAAGAAYIGLMTVATLTEHRGKGYFVFSGGWEYTLLVAMVALGIVVVGPGGYSADRVIGLEDNLSGSGWGLIALVVGLVAALVMVLMFYRPKKTAPEVTQDEASAAVPEAAEGYVDQAGHAPHQRVETADDADPVSPSGEPER